MTRPTAPEIRSQILDLVGQYYAAAHSAEDFAPGETPIRFGGRIYDASELQSLVAASLDFWLTEGPYSDEFAHEFSSLHQVKYCVLTNSGSSANLLAFSALLSPNLKERRLRPGDEVIGVAAAFPTTVNPIIQNQCIPVFLDISLSDYNVDVSQLDDALSTRTRAIFLAHTLGNPFNLRAVMDFARKHELFVIEDTCDALGSLFEGKLVGTFGDLSTFSFYPPHHITMGEGGAVLTRNSRLYRAVTSLRNWGRDCWCAPGFDNTCGKRFGWQMGQLPLGYDHKYIVTHLGYNLKQTDLQAAVGLAQLRKLPSFEAARRRNFARLYEGLTPYEEFFHLPRATPNSDPCWFGFPLTVRPTAPFTRRALVDFLEQRKVLTRSLFAGNILRQPAYQGLPHRTVGSLERTDYALEHAFWFGVYPGLSDAMIDYTIEMFDTFVRGV